MSGVLILGQSICGQCIVVGRLNLLAKCLPIQERSRVIVLQEYGVIGPTLRYVLQGKNQRITVLAHLHSLLLLGLLGFDLTRSRFLLSLYGNPLGNFLHRYVLMPEREVSYPRKAHETEEEEEIGEPSVGQGKEMPHEHTATHEHGGQKEFGVLGLQSTKYLNDQGIREEDV